MLNRRSDRCSCSKRAAVLRLSPAAKQSCEKGLQLGASSHQLGTLRLVSPVNAGERLI